MRIITLFALAFAASSANAATVTFTLEFGYNGPGTFRLTAETRPVTFGEPNFGIASYGVQLVGNPVAVPTGSILTVNHNSLRAASVENAAQEEGPAGFTSLRSPDLTAAQPDQSAHTVSATQDTITPTPHLVKGFGQEASSLAAKGLVGTAAEGNPWAARMVIAVGTYVRVNYGGSPFTARGINFSPTPGATTFANVFTSPDGGATAPANINRVIEIPEPTSLLMAGIALLGIVGVALRRPFSVTAR